MLRGQLYWVNLTDTNPPETRGERSRTMGKIRPAVIISNTDQNQFLSTVVVVPLSTKAGEIWPIRVSLENAVSPRESFAVVTGIRQISKSRLVKQGRVLSAPLLGRLAQAVNEYLTD